MTIDVSDAFDTDITDQFTVMRRVQTIDSTTGRSGISVEGTFENVDGVVTISNPDDLERLDDSQRMGRNITIVTSFMLRGPAPGYQPDIVQWQGDNYLVKAVDPYPHAGDGFVQAIAGSVDSIDQPPEGPQAPADNTSNVVVIE